MCKLQLIHTHVQNRSPTLKMLSASKQETIACLWLQLVCISHHTIAHTWFGRINAGCITHEAVYDGNQ